MRILLVEDDGVLRENTATILRRSSYAVDTAESFAVATEKTSNPDYDLVILDWKLPDGNGLELCRELRKNDGEVKIIMLTSNNQTEDKIEGLDAGADDYLTKPFEIGELLARIRSLLRRSGAAVAESIIIDDLQIDIAQHRVVRSGEEIELTSREYALLEYLAINKNRAVSREEIMTHVWDENANIFSNTVDVHIKYLRDKIDMKSSKKLIRTVKGKGYALTEGN